MQLSAPWMITARLMAGVKVGDAYLSIGYGKISSDGRQRYDIWIDIDRKEYHVTDLKSVCQGGDLREGMSSLLSFLTAAAESYDYRQRTGRSGENEDLFQPAIVEWASTVSDELSMLQLEIDEQPETIKE